MKKLKFLVLMLVATFAIVGSYSPAPAAAFNPFDGVNCSTHKSMQSPVCQAKSNPPTSNPLTGKDGLLIKIANLVAMIAGVAAVIIIVLAGLRFVTSGGSTEDVVGARRAIIYTVVGLIVIVLARTLIVLVIGKL